MKLLRFSKLELSLIGLMVAIVAFMAVYSQRSSTETIKPSAQVIAAIGLQLPITSTGPYKIVGVQSYLCTQAAPDNCSGTIMLEDQNGGQLVASVDNKTTFGGANPALLNRANQSVIRANVELTDSHVDSIKVQ